MATSPFAPDPEPVIEEYALDDLVSHDTYGMGRVIRLEAGAVVVDFGAQAVRIASPFPKMAKL
jgi:predicted 2-oxoglutarate/Fe(II)-dependent dioxygenase YbiX